MDLKTAYDILGLEENATREELKVRYFELTEQRISRDKLDDIQTAYNIIREHINVVNPPPQETWYEKTKDFVVNYKIPVMIGIVSVILLGAITFSITNGIKENREKAQNPPDLYLLFFGNFVSEDLDSLKADIKANFTEWDQLKLQIEYSPGEEGTEMQMGAAQKAQVFLATEEPDIYIFDQHFFDIFNDDNLYLELDQLKNPGNQLLDENGAVIGLDVTDHDIFSEMENAENNKFMVIPKQAKSRDHAIEFITKLAE